MMKQVKIRQLKSFDGGEQRSERKSEVGDLLLDMAGLLANLKKRARNGKFNTITTLNVLCTYVAPTLVCATGS